jgi:hypothetical protein
MLGQICRSGSKGIARFLQSRPSPKDATRTVGRRRESVLEPGIKGAVHEIRRLVFGGDLEQRIDAGFDRALAQ